MKKYIGIKPKSTSSSGNEGHIWEENEDGTFTRTNKLVNGRPFTITKEAFEHDLQLKYLKEYDG